MKKLLIAVALALSAAACSPGGSPWQKSYGKTFYEPNDGMAALYIIRDDPGQDASPIGITSAQTPVGGLTGSKVESFLDKGIQGYREREDQAF